VVRRGLIVACVSLLWPQVAGAQGANSGYAGFASASIGGARGGDVNDGGWTPGASVAIIEASGLGAEVDLSHVFNFNGDQYLESGVTTLTINFTGVVNHDIGMVRPYATGGVGVLRLRVCGPACRTRTDWGFDVGGGAFVMFHESWGVRGDVRYFRYFDRLLDSPLVDAGYFDFWRISAGATFEWPIR
jgi:Outer membrane protein beta-barrel domain